MPQINIKEARMAVGLTQKELAAKVGIPYQSIQKLEYGSRDPGRMEARTLIAFAEALGVDPHALI